MKLSFLQWLTLLNPETRVRITMSNGFIYEGKHKTPLSFNVSLVDIDFNKQLSTNK